MNIQDGYLIYTLILKAGLLYGYYVMMVRGDTYDKIFPSRFTLRGKVTDCGIYGNSWQASPYPLNYHGPSAEIYLQAQR